MTNTYKVLRKQPDGQYIKVPMSYAEVCKELGDYIPDIHFVRITTAGTISFWLGKPDEIRALYHEVVENGFKPSGALTATVRRISPVWIH